MDRTTRLRKIRVLLTHRYDYLPTGGRNEFSSAPGPAPSQRIECPDCGGVDNNNRHLSCYRCGGTGTTKVDPYIKDARVPGLDPTTRNTMELHEIERTLENLRIDALARDGITIGKDSTDRSIEHFQCGCVKGCSRCGFSGSSIWGRLEATLQALAERQDGRYAALTTLYWSGPIVISQSTMNRALLGELWVEMNLPGQLIVPRHLEKEVSEKRELEVYVSWCKHHSVRAVAREMNMDRRHVKRILRNVAGPASGLQAASNA